MLQRGGVLSSGAPGLAAAVLLSLLMVSAQQVQGAGGPHRAGRGRAGSTDHADGSADADGTLR